MEKKKKRKKYLTREKIKPFKEKVKNLIAKGYTNVQISKICGVANSTVVKYKQEILDNAEDLEDIENYKVEDKKIVVEEAKNSLEKTLQDYKERTIANNIQIVDLLGEKIIQAIKDNRIPPNVLGTLFGTIVDKTQVLSGGKTQNVSISYEELLKEINKGSEY